VEYLRPQTIIGKFGTNGIPSLRRVPFRTPLISQTGGGAGYWVGEGKAKPLTSFDFARTTLEPLKVANIAVLTDEVIRSSSPSAEGIVRDQLVAALQARLDIDFIDPAKTASAGVSPASITNAAANGAASGTGDADDVRADIRSLLNEYIAANNPPSTGVLIMRSGTALALSMMVNALGQAEFNGIGMNGGNLLSIPVITSEHVPSGIIVMVNASDIYLADEGGFRLDMSREASVEMLDSGLTGESAPGVTNGTAASTVSLWQTNSVGFLAERTINWAARRSTAVAYLSGVAWGGAVNDLS
jgi:HK97 family phage major capsid protein